MTEQEWWDCNDPLVLFQFLLPRASNRKLRLFACGIWRRTLAIVPGGGQTHLPLLDLAEGYADGAQTDAALARAKALPEARGAAMQFCLSDFKGEDLLGLTRILSAFSFENPLFLCRSQARLVRDLFCPLPFRTVRIEPGWLTGKDGAVLKLAQDIYKHDSFDRMPELGRALADAGCQDPEVLGHCKQEGHVRGCWLIDVLLAKE